MSRKWIKLVSVLIVMLMCLICGCGVVNRPMKDSGKDVEATTEEMTVEVLTEDTSAEVVVGTTEAVTEEETEPVKRQISVSCRNIGYRRKGDGENPAPKIISSRAELLEFQKEYGTVFDFDYEMPIRDAVTDVLCQSFNSAVELYDEAWFTTNTLIFMSVKEPNLGYYYKAADALLENNVLNIEYERHAPLFLSGAISVHLFLVELEISNLPENVTINWTRTVMPSPWDDLTQEATGGN